MRVVQRKIPIVERRQRRNRRPRKFARHLDGSNRRNDAAAVDEVTGRRKEFDPVQEEWAFLGKEECLPRIDLKLRRVRFDLREVGIHGGIHRQIRRDAPPRIAAHVRPSPVVRPSVAARCPVSSGGDRGVEIHDETATHVLQADQGAGLVEE
jgi:hypothetical protein